MSQNPKTEAELQARKAELLLKEASVRDLVAGLAPQEQLVVLLTAYLGTAKALGQLQMVGMALMEIGSSIVMSEMTERPATTAVPAPAQSDHHPAPPTVQ